LTAKVYLLKFLKNPARARLAETPYRPFHWQETDYPGTKKTLQI